MHQGRYATNVVLAFAVLACTSAFAAAPPGASLSGELSVTQSGAASYSLPLLTPPGVLEEIGDRPQLWGVVGGGFGAFGDAIGLTDSPVGAAVMGGRGQVSRGEFCKRITTGSGWLCI